MTSAPAFRRGFPEKPDEKSEKELKVEFTYQVTFHPGGVMVKIVGTDRDTIFDLVKKIEALTANPLDLPKIDPSMAEAFSSARMRTAFKDTEPEWIEWHGGACPVPKGTDVEIRFKDGDVVRDDDPHAWDWKHMGRIGDIVAYRVLSK